MNKKSTILKIILGLIFAISFEMISFQLIIVYNTIINWITGGVSFFCALYFWKITVDDTYDKIKKNKAFSVICAFLTSIVIYKLYLVKGMQFKDGFNNWIINPFRLRSFIISGISAIYIGIFLGNKLKECIS